MIMKKLFALLALLLCSLPARADDIWRCCNMTSKLNISSSATVIKPASCNLIAISVTAAASTAGSANDSATTGGVAASNLMFTIPATVGVYYVPMPFLNGLVITPGSGQVISVSYQ